MRIAVVRAGLTTCLIAMGGLALAWPPHVAGHPSTRREAERARQRVQARDQARAESPSEQDQASSQLTLELYDLATNRPLPGIVRVTRVDNGKAVRLPGLIARDNNWFVIDGKAEVAVPPTVLRVEAVRGLESRRAERQVDAREGQRLSVRLPLAPLVPAGDLRQQGWRSGNTHLHLMRLTHAEAVDYLRTVPRADELDLLYVSHLRRVPDERHYITNQFTAADLARLSTEQLLLVHGQEHRHNFGPGGEGYGHVMFLDLLQLIQPVSIGPGIMGEGTDGLPLQAGIQAARRAGATVVWCHNTFGYEDLPNWAAGLLDAQNIFDGGTHGSYEDTFYRYLNLGLRVPFSTGTDWFIYDFSRVYVPVDGQLTSESWLRSLAAGRSFITNGPLLELTVDGQSPGDVLNLERAAEVQVRGRAWGRHDFRGLELIHNGQVRQAVVSQSVDGHFTADLQLPVPIDRPGWFALRIPLEAGRNEFDRPLFAHTSPVYINFQHRRPFDPEVARRLIAEIEGNIERIEAQARFADDAERERVLRVHQAGIEAIQRWLRQGASDAGRAVQPAP
ncbi:MAG: CehA/McbA family metallohydrolase [Pirellulaceae bacterium]|nr:CehA/McbA family metallohydrolase [Pirellulaceae bacterium]